MQEEQDERPITSLDDLHAIANGEEIPVEKEEDAESTEEQSTEEDEGLETGEVPPEEQFNPILNYTVKGEARDIDERFHSIINSKEDNDYIIDILTRADGLETYKEKYGALEGKYGTLEDQAKIYLNGYQELKKARDEGNMERIEEALGLTEEMIINRALALIEHEELPEEQRVLMEQNKALQNQVNTIQSRVSSFETQSDERRVEADVSELRNYMGSEEYSGVVGAMAEKNIDFAQEVVSRGIYLTKMRGAEPSIKEVVDMVSEQYSWLIPQEETITETNKQPIVQQQATIPSVKGGTNSAVEKPITSIDQLRKLADQVGGY
jgi:hypothetical protein